MEGVLVAYPLGRHAQASPTARPGLRPHGPPIAAPARANDVPVVLAFDGDAAGVEAGWKAWDMLADLQTPGLTIATLEPNRDPAQLTDDELDAALTPAGRQSEPSRGEAGCPVHAWSPGPVPDSVDGIAAAGGPGGVRQAEGGHRPASP